MTRADNDGNRVTAIVEEEQFQAEEQVRLSRGHTMAKRQPPRAAAWASRSLNQQGKESGDQSTYLSYLRPLPPLHRI